MLPSDIEILGDPHIGKVFRIGVPRDRLGEREASQWEDFEKSLNTDKGLHVNVGDLFDEIEVSYKVILRTAQTYKQAARRRPGTTFVIIFGNHDGSRDNDVVSAYELFREMVSDTPNIICLKDEAVEIDDNLFVPWNPFCEAADMLPAPTRTFSRVFGHWDVASSGANHIPVEKLRLLTSHIITGHEHKPQEFTDNGLTVTLTGSMQPYAHGEEVIPSKYRTFTTDELKEFEGCTHDLCIRIKLQPGEHPPEVDCLQLQTITIDPDKPDTDELEVKAEDFDLHSLFNEVFDEHEVNEPTKESVWTDFKSEGA